MTGRNELLFNTATMIEIVQHYLDTVLFKEGHGAKINYIRSWKDGSSDVFKVDLIEAEKTNA